MAGAKKEDGKEYSSNWGGKRAGGGRRKGSPNKGTELGRKTIYTTITLSAKPEEAARIRELANDSGKSISRFIIDCVGHLYPKD